VRPMIRVSIANDASEQARQVRPVRDMRNTIDDIDTSAEGRDVGKRARVHPEGPEPPRSVWIHHSPCCNFYFCFPI